MIELQLMVGDCIKGNREFNSVIKRKREKINKGINNLGGARMEDDNEKEKRAAMPPGPAINT